MSHSVIMEGQVSPYKSDNATQKWLTSLMQSNFLCLLGSADNQWKIKVIWEQTRKLSDDLDFFLDYVWCYQHGWEFCGWLSYLEYEQ